MAFHDDDLELYFSAAATTSTIATSSTTVATATSSGDDQGYNWNNWSPIMDWDYDFHSLIETVMGGDEAIILDPPLPGDDHDQEACNSILIDTMTPLVADPEEPKTDDFQGLRLVHLLVAAAEALAGANKTRELARVIVNRLKELVSPNDKSNMERLAAHFTTGLSSFLEQLSGGGPQANKRQSLSGGPNHQHHHRDDHDQMDVITAFQLLQDMSPYINFGYFTANQAILEVTENDRRIHIVDYDIMEGVQWASLMQALVSRKIGHAVQHLRITALSRDINRRKSITAVQEAGRRLTAFAESIGQPFSFNHCKLDSNETFKSSALKLVRGEVLVINCMLHLPCFSHQTQKPITSFLIGAKTLNPRLVTLAEEEVGLTGDEGFMGRFMDSLYKFSAMFDSLEAGLPITSHTRGFVERVFLSPWISESLNRISTGYGGDLENCSLGQWLETNGFKPYGISFANHCQAKLLLGLYKDGYRVEELGSNRLVLGWKSRRLVSASVWTSPESDENHTQ